MGFDGVISVALADCVGLSCATQLIVLSQSGGSLVKVPFGSSAEEIIYLISEPLVFYGGNINMFVSNILKVTAHIAERGILLPHVLVSPLVWVYV